MAKVFLTPQAQRDLKKIPRKYKEKIFKKFSSLKESPLSGKKLVGKLKGFYSLRVWPYRVIYLIKSKSQVWIVHIAHRQKVYK